MRTVNLKVEGWRCTACSASIGSLLEAHAGVRGVEVSFDEGRVRVLYEPALTSTERLIQLIEKRGFQVVARSPA